MHPDPKTKNFYRNVILCLLIGACIFIFFPFLSTLALSGIFAFVLYPSLDRIQRSRIFGRKFAGRRRSAIALLLFIFVVFAVPITIVGTRLYAFIVEFSADDRGRQLFVDKISTYGVRLKEMLWPWIQRMTPSGTSLSLNQISNEAIQRGANLTFQYSVNLLRSIPSLLIGTFVFFAALYYFLVEAKRIRHFMQETGLFSRREIIILTDGLRNSCFAAVLSSVLTGIVQAAIVAVGAQMTDLGSFGFIFSITFFFSFIPIVGTAPVALGLAMNAFLTDNYRAAVIILCVAAFAGALDNILRPLFMGRNNRRIHPLVSLLSILGGILVLGAPGLFIGPVLAEVTIIAFPQLIKNARPEQKIPFVTQNDPLINFDADPLAQARLEPSV